MSNSIVNDEERLAAAVEEYVHRVENANRNKHRPSIGNSFLLHSKSYPITINSQIFYAHFEQLTIQNYWFTFKGILIDSSLYCYREACLPFKFNSTRDDRGARMESLETVGDYFDGSRSDTLFHSALLCGKFHLGDLNVTVKDGD